MELYEAALWYEIIFFTNKRLMFYWVQVSRDNNFIMCWYLGVTQ